MQVILHADHNTDGRHQMAEHLETVVNASLARFAERVTRVEAYLSDADGRSKADPEGIHCTMEARIVGLPAVVAKDHAGNAHQAIEGAIHKLKRAIGDAIERHHPRHQHADATVDATPDVTD